jgi:hypothetical protein
MRNDFGMSSDVGMSIQNFKISDLLNNLEDILGAIPGVIRGVIPLFKNLEGNLCWLVN